MIRKRTPPPLVLLAVGLTLVALGGATLPAVAVAEESDFDRGHGNDCGGYDDDNPGASNGTADQSGNSRQSEHCDDSTDERGNEPAEGGNENASGGSSGNETTVGGGDGNETTAGGDDGSGTATGGGDGNGTVDGGDGNGTATGSANETRSQDEGESGGDTGDTVSTGDGGEPDGPTESPAGDGAHGLEEGGDGTATDGEATDDAESGNGSAARGGTVTPGWADRGVGEVGRESSRDDAGGASRGGYESAAPAGDRGEVRHLTPGGRQFAGQNRFGVSGTTPGPVAFAGALSFVLIFLLAVAGLRSLS